jgi:CDP-diacylglycerol---glycerol-3-phosphate 3-phosphatidyltransferase
MHKENGENGDIAALRSQWGLFVVICILFLAGGFIVFWFAWQPVFAARWMLLSAIIIVYQLVVLWRNLSANYRPDEGRLLPDLGWGNRLTLLRGVFVAGMIGFLFLPQPASWLAWLPGILYILSDAADFFDGYVARITNHTTHLGESLDISFDGLGVLAASLLAVQYGQVPVWYLLVGGARYLFLAWLWLRRALGQPVYDLPNSLARRIFAGMQMGFLAVVLLPLFSPPGTHIAAALFGLPLLAGFIYDGLYVSGLLRPTQGMQTKSYVSLERGLPVGLRLLVLALNADSIAKWITEFRTLPPALAMLGLINTLVVTLLILGVLPRITAILALCLLGFYQMLADLSMAQIILATIYALIIYIGGGAFSLWSPEEHLFRNRAGEQKTLNAELVRAEEVAG